ncbi:unnamed protein product [Candida verbasci]|uniref:Autophagy-related protein 28 n=1 Tax=Candida verbasci TaxID=1227364 RepID=A0A9W4TXB3_9ASCO|nr:unnamed protein product [Candida verbasci]
MSSNSNGFDSINLASTIQSGLTRRPQVHSIVPASTSEEEDEENNKYEDDLLEEEDEIDPEEFILSNREDNSINSNSQRRTRTPSSLQDTSFLEDSNILKSFDSMKDSILNQDNNKISAIDFNILPNQNNISPIEFLSSKIKQLSEDLESDSKLYEQFLKNGNSVIDKLRNKILFNFNQLSECYLSLNELYSKEKTYSESLLKSFKNWDDVRTNILAKVKLIKSEKSKYGKKMANLLNQSSELDNEIAEVELKLKSLRFKKLLLDKEIEDTSSVLESKTAKYVNTFKELEIRGKEAMTNFLQYNGVPESEISRIVQHEQVNVTFLKNVIATELKPQDSTPSAQIVQDQESKIIGMQPFNPENLIIQQQDLSSMNHDHGPTPYERGFAKGSQNSAQLKSQLNNVLKKLFEKLPNNESPVQNYPKAKVDDYSNTVNEKLDLEPILKFLQSKSDALNDLIVQTSSKSAMYHNFSDVWNNVVSLLTKQEEKLKMVLEDSVVGKVNQEVVNVLNLTLNHLEIFLTQIQDFKNINKEETLQKEQLITLVHNDIDAVKQGLNLISSQSTSSGVNDKFGFKKSFSNIPTFSEPTSQIQKINSNDVANKKIK